MSAPEEAPAPTPRRVPRDIFGREVGMGDLVAYGHSGRYAGTRVGRVYRIEGRRVRVWILEKGSDKVWRKVSHSEPNGIVKIDDTDLLIPKLEDL